MKAELIDFLGNDDTVVNAARVSFDKEAGQYSKDKNSKLIGYLARHGHFTPFTHAQITLRYTVPIFIARQEAKHQVGFTRNEVSRRYVDDEPEFFLPDNWRKRPDGSVKQGSGSNLEEHDDLAADEMYLAAVQSCENAYFYLLEQGVAPEQARMVLPQSMYTSYYITGSLAAFARFYRQRTDSHAQVEIQELAHQVGDIISPLFPVSWEALTQ
tara:strand:- start:648 stop:1286 length:639 start_codon:yes stop_codon:yes gene_type:complete